MLQRNTLQDRFYKRGRTWWVWGYDCNGVRYHESTRQTDCSASGGPGKAALAAGKAIEVRRAVPAAPGSNSPTLAEALKEAVLTAERADSAENTIKSYVNRGKHLLAGYGGSTRLDAIELQDSNSYMDKRLQKEGAGRYSIYKEIALLIQLCHEQKELGRYSGAPKRLMPRPLRSPEDYYELPDTWLDTQEQIDALLRHLADPTPPKRGRDCGPRRLFVRAQGPGVPPLELVRRAKLAGIAMTRRQAIEARAEENRAMRRVARKRREPFVSRVLHVIAYLQSGMRDSELDTIFPEDVNLQTRSLHIRGTKTKGSKRDIQMSPTLVAVMKEKMKGKTRGEPLFEPWPNAIREFNRAWTAARKEAMASAKTDGRVLQGMWPEHITHNTFRRTFCSLMFNADVSPQVCADLLGHTSTKLVMHVYGKLSRKTLQAAVDRLPVMQLPAEGTVTAFVTPGLPKSPRKSVG
jgi:integrase